MQMQVPRPQKQHELPKHTNEDGTDQKHSDRKRSKRKQNAQETPTPEKRTKRMESDSTSDWLKEVWKDINASVDKLMIIKRHDNRNQRATWHLVQADLDETNERRARKMGEYHVRCYIKQFADAKKRLVRNCRYWPLIRALKPDGSFGDIVYIRPCKVEKTLTKKVYTRGWYQSETNLAEDGLAGPFNFSTLQGETHRIDEEIWKVLATCEGVKSGRVDIDDLSRIIPLH